MDKKEVDKYLEKISTELKLRDCSPRTIETYNFFLLKFFKTIAPEKSAENITLENCRNFLAGLIDKYSNKSRALAVSSLRFFFSRILDKPEVYVKLRVPKKEEKLPVVLTMQEIRDLINSTKNKKSKLIIKMLYSSGLRVSELVNLKSNDIDFNENTGWVRRGKGKKDRLFKIALSISKQLQKYINKNPENKYIFSNSNNKHLTTRNIQLLIKKAAKKAGINKKVTPHTLRHSFATHLLEAGENLLVIQNLLGHKNLETTKVYTHLSTDEIKKVKSPLDRL